jgi:hypothetical protein
MGNIPIIAIIIPKTAPPTRPAMAPAMIDLIADGCCVWVDTVVVIVYYSL